MKTERKSVLGLVFLAPVLVLAPVLLLSGCFTLTRPALPQVRGSVVVEGLNDQVEIHRDSVGVAHIIASCDEDAFFAQGYVHAQERFYQMEFWRRVGAGRLSELFGDAVLASDIYLRTMGFRRVAEQVYADAPPLLKTSLDAYAAGVNAYITDMKPRKLAAEFALLGLQGLDMEIEPWTPLDTLTWPKVMSQDLGADYTIELLRLDVIRAVGITMAQDFFASYRYDEMPTVIHAEDLQGSSSGTQETNTPDADLALYDNP
ncbi:MAG: penicillin acylase family protein, partial [Spirochaetaceae bacterium]|nr:penicillin acylase family protein [Spirochaetaceae bacterium]